MNIFGKIVLIYLCILTNMYSFFAVIAGIKFLFFSILAELDMSGNLAKTHIFTHLHPTNPISHLGRSQFFLGSIFSIL